MYAAPDPREEMVNFIRHELPPDAVIAWSKWAQKDNQRPFNTYGTNPPQRFILFPMWKQQTMTVDQWLAANHVTHVLTVDRFVNAYVEGRSLSYLTDLTQRAPFYRALGHVHPCLHHIKRDPESTYALSLSLYQLSAAPQPQP